MSSEVRDMSVETLGAGAPIASATTSVSHSFSRGAESAFSGNNTLTRSIGPTIEHRASTPLNTDRAVGRAALSLPKISLEPKAST
ncbi:MAG: hypothetical protein ABIO02_03100, partial [Patescibacteria group bacterium]